MSSQAADIKPFKLFAGSCITLIATAMTFAVLSSIIDPLKKEFLLTNQQVGLITGAGLWGFPISILIFGPLCSVLGMRFLLRMAYGFFFIGVGVMVFASGFWMLFFGALTIAFANGLVEGACNPLVATIYPDRKTQKLNQFHVWFPGGIVIGGLICFAMDQYSFGNWQIKLCLILVPAVISAAMMMFEKFPLTERAQSGVSFWGMVQAALCRPLFLLMFVCMMLTASVELGPNRWIPAVLDAGGIHGMLVLVWTSLLMALLRQFSGPAVKKLSPTGMLLSSAILSGIGLYGLSFAGSGPAIFIADTVFAIGVCYFWPTMLGVVSERVPKGGEFALALMGAAGNVAAGFITIPLMGTIADYYGHEEFKADATVAVVRQASEFLPTVRASSANAELNAAIDETLLLSKQVITEAETSKTLPANVTANALRGIIKCSPQDAPIVAEAKKLLNPAELYGGRMSFRIVAGLAVILVLVFGALYATDRRKGGYKTEHIAA
ncbi:MAG TPA: MFS transporter [Candidatus Hydrogenedentes bacterium]|nr:MFS transporter [Candidatus Hydrogenedentota bacterium]